MIRYIISDTHFNHPNIITYCNRPVDSQQQMIDNWKRIVKPDDLVYHLGDVIFDRPNELEDILRNLPGKKVLVRGNHDNHSDTWYMNKGFDFVCDGLVVRKTVVLSHKPISVETGKANIHGHLHNLGYEDMQSFQEWYGSLHDSNHILYSPELEQYKPIALDKLLSRGDTIVKRTIILSD